MSDSTSTRSDRVRALLCCLGLTLCVIALFGRVVWHPFIAFDDAEYILRNPQVTSPTRSLWDLLLTPKTGYVIPVTVAFEALLYGISRGQAWSFHGAAIALHGLFACQVFALARRLGTGRPWAFVGALLFAVHPLVVQPVAWAICIKDLLMANLVLAATHAFLASAGTSLRRSAAVLAVVLALLAMLAKPSAALLGGAWLAYLFARRSGSPQAPDETASSMRASLAAVVIGAFIGAASRFAHDALLDHGAIPWSAWKPVEVLGRQLWHVLWPANLLIVYPDPLTEPVPVLGVLGLAAISAAVYAVLRFRSAPARLLPLALALLIYVPTSNALPFSRTMSDSYMYVPLAGLALLVAATVEAWVLARGPITRRLAGSAALLVALALAASSSAQLSRWRGGSALWEPVVRRHPRLAVAHRLMGDEMVFRGRPDLAVQPYRRAFALDYDGRFLLEYGTVLSMAGRLPDAECVLIEAVAFGNNSGYAVYNYAALLAFNASYAPRYPGPARQLLGRLDALRAAGKVQWPAALEAGLKVQIDRVRDAPPPPHWPRRNCRMLRRE